MRQYRINIEKVESDDFGDKHWKYHARLMSDELRYWEEYYPTEPTLKRVLADSLEALTIGDEDENRS